MKEENAKYSIILTREERVKRYMEILKKEGKGNSVRNWDILDRLSDGDLFNPEKIAACVHIMDTIVSIEENNSTKYSEDIMEYVRQYLGLDAYDTSRDDEINNMATNEVFEIVCTWNGLVNYAATIKSWIKDIYSIDLDENSDLLSKKQEDMKIF